ncbi:hypothetical protein FRC01_002583 [Tulasnella sp. 417]|nr:hypothetical protein FRC01_002583 [Tulasnella sp. 417]
MPVLDSNHRCTTPPPTSLHPENRISPAMLAGAENHYVQQATQERKRTASGTSSSRNKTRGNSGGSSLDSTTSYVIEVLSSDIRVRSGLTTHTPPFLLLSTNASGSATPSPGPSSALALSFSPPPSLGSPVSGHPNATLALLRWIFSPTYQTSLPEHVGGAPYQASRAVVLAAGKAAAESFRNIRKPTEADWGDVSKKLSEDTFLTEFAYDLIEVYMQICHTRQPILDPKEFRARFRHSLPTHLIPAQSISADSPTPPGNLEPIPPALLAVVIAWGSKDDDDYDTPHLAATSFGSPADPVLPAGVQAASWYSSLHALAVIIRRMCRILWIPATESDGIPYDRLVSLVAMYSSWRDEHLDRVGVPSNFEADWDFVAAVTACSSDATFHLMWIILSQALEEYGIKELNVLRAADPTTEVPEFEALKQNINEEATHGALRIAGLAGVLTNNGYLRLDPNALHYGIYAAGMAYEDALDQAAELEQIYAQTLAAGQHVQSPISPGHGLQFSPTDMGQAQAMAMAFSSPQHDFSGSAFGGQAQLSPFSPSYPHDLYQP